jgi:hypothetical protein
MSQNCWATIVTGNEEINELCLEWFKDAVNRRINVAEPLLKEKALVYANVLGNTNFKVMIQIILMLLIKKTINLKTVYILISDVFLS